MPDSRRQFALDQIQKAAELKTVHLDLGGNRLTTVPPEIGQLTELTSLDLSGNNLKSLPAEIFQLTNLRSLDLFANQLTQLPQEIRRLERLERLDLRSNQLPIPPEILEKTDDPNTIVAYYFSPRTKPLNEIKLLFLGQGSVGKTSIIQRILHDTYNPNQHKTNGIEINRWQIEGRHLSGGISSRVRINVWDFGGQEIMHATHQFFLTKRSLYLLILDARLTQEENRVEHWLKIIQSLGGNSPVIVVGNKKDQHPLDIDRSGLRNKYPNIVDIVETSAFENKGIVELKHIISEQVGKLEHVHDPIPETWLTIKTRFEELGQHKKYLTYDEYVVLCKENGIVDESDQETLVYLLHHIGTLLYFQDDPHLATLGVLDPEWVTNGVYKIINSNDLFQSKGVLTLNMLNDILNTPEYPRNKRMFIVEMMKKFELCYNIDDNSFLVPDLLSKDEPDTGNWDGSLAFEYQYDVLLPRIISRFIVRMNEFVHRPTTWRNGVLIKKGNNRALVKADNERKTISIRVSGNESTRRDLLAAIRTELESIHMTIAKLEVHEKVPHPEFSNMIFDYQELLQFEKDGIKEFPKSVDGKSVRINVGQLLGGIKLIERPRSTIDLSENIVLKKKEGRTVNPWKSGSFYITSFSVGVVAYLIARSLNISNYDILFAFGLGVATMFIVGILQLRNDDHLSDASFVALASEFFKRFPFFRKAKND